MADVLRGPVVQPVQTPPQFRLTATVAVNLLVTVLGVLALPPGEQALASQFQHPAKKNYLNQNTSQTSQRLIMRTDPGLPPGQEALTQQSQHRAKAFWINRDTSQTSQRLIMRTDPLPPIGEGSWEEHTVPDRNRSVVDTSQGMPDVLQGIVAPAPFVVNPTAWSLTNPWQTVDTSKGTAKTLYGDVTFPFQITQHSAPDRLRPVVDTSHGWLPLDVIIAPSIPYPTAWPLTNPWQVVDTSKGTPKTLYGDVTFPFQSPLQLQPDRIRPVVDTTHGFTPPTELPPIVNNPTAWPLRTPWQVVDTSQGSTFYIPATAPVVPYPTAWDLRLPWQVVDTTLSTPAVAFVTPPDPPPPQPAMVVILRPNHIFSETSQGTGNGLRDDDPGPPPPPPAQFHIGGADEWRKPKKKQPKDEEFEELLEAGGVIVQPAPKKTAEAKKVEEVPVDVEGLSNAVNTAKVLAEAYLREQSDDDDDFLLLMGS